MAIMLEMPASPSHEISLRLKTYELVLQSDRLWLTGRYRGKSQSKIEFRKIRLNRE